MSDQKSNNTIAAFHIMRKSKDGILKLNTSKMYHWHIPKSLRQDPIEPGDIVLVRTDNTMNAVLVMQVFREELEETQKRYKRVVMVKERKPKKERVI